MFPNVAAVSIKFNEIEDFITPYYMFISAWRYSSCYLVDEL